MPVFPLFYTGNVQYYKHLANASSVQFDLHEHFVKQTQRNRLEILGPNGRQMLVIPIQKTGNKMIMGDVQISYAENWQKVHWKSFEAAYRKSPYFEFYEEEFFPFYHSKTTHLADFNLKLFQLICKLAKIKIDYSISTSYETCKPDLRSDVFEAKKMETYLQVFSDRYSFVSNLSILDVLFNIGPDTRNYLLDPQ